MGANDILQKFKVCFPLWADEVVMYKPLKGHEHAIKIELTGKRFYIFTYTDDRTIRLETIRSYEKDKN